jgi:hypothetical protein
VELVKLTIAVSIVFIYVFYFYLAMESSPFGFLFGNTTTTVVDVEQPPPAQVDPFKIPTRIIECVIDNCYLGNGTVHPGDHLLFIHELCELFKCAGITPS